MMSNLFKKLMLYTLVVSCGSTGLLQAEGNGSRFGTLFGHASNYANNATEWVKKNKVAAYATAAAVFTTVLWINEMNNSVKADKRHKAEKNRSSRDAEQAKDNATWHYKQLQTDKAAVETQLKKAEEELAVLERQNKGLLEKQKELAKLQADLAAADARVAQLSRPGLVQAQQNQQDLKQIDGRRKAAVKRNWRLARRLVVAKQKQSVTARSLVEDMYKQIDALNIVKAAERETFVAQFNAALAEEAAQRERDSCTGSCKARKSAYNA